MNSSYPTTPPPPPTARPYRASALAQAVQTNLQNVEPGDKPYDMVLKIARLKLDAEYAHLKNVKWSLKKDEVRRVVIWAL
ncbi:MAG TPA: hypothetical protein VFD70_07185, partial [Anaerolineae bacterium]|nr:hypothetical protein [Anaerolineae bacterium]